MPALTEDQLAAWRQLQWATALITGRFRRDLAAGAAARARWRLCQACGWAR